MFYFESTIPGKANNLARDGAFSNVFKIIMTL